MGRSGGSAHRSGGGGRSHGGGGGIARRSSPPRRYHSPPHHHHGPGYHHSPHRHHYWYGGGSGYRCSGNIGGLCAIPLFIVFVVVLCILVLASSPSVTIDTIIENCEQVISCPSSLDGDINFKSSGYDAVAYLVKKLPGMNPNTTDTPMTISGGSIPAGEYIFNSFNLVKGSSLAWDIVEPRGVSFTFYLIKGESEYKKYHRYQDFHYLKTSSTSHADDSYTVSDSDEYFMIIEASYTSVNVGTFDVTVTHTKYDLTNFITRSAGTTSFSVSSSDIPGACVIVDMPCGCSAKDEIKIDYNEKRSTVYWVCLSICLLFGFGMVASVVVCIVCIMKKKKGTTGSTYQQVPSTPAQPTSYPVGYQQPTAPAVAGYQDPNAYQVPPQDPTAYAAGAPPPATYDGSNPAAYTGAINTTPASYAPGYEQNYGTAAPPVY